MSFDNKNKEPLVSVLLPTFNGGEKLLIAVHSILDQTYKNFELLILDDGSSDNSIDLVKRNFSDKRILIFSDGLKRGLAGILNYGVWMSKGLYIARMDADDISFPNRLELQVNHLINNSSLDLVASRAVIYSLENSNPILYGFLPFRQTHDKLVKQLWRGIPMPHPTWMGKAEWFKKNPYAIPEVIRAEDQDLLLRSSPHSKYHCLPETLLAYYLSDKNGLDFHKSWQARRSLWISQVKFFYHYGRITDIVMSTCNFIVKAIFDVFFSLGISRSNLYFYKKISNERQFSNLESYCVRLLEKSKLI